MYSLDFILSKQSEEEVLSEDRKRYTILPIDKKYEDIWNLYKKHEAAIWKAEEIDYAGDLKCWETLLPEEKFFIEHVLAFFASSDGIVNENLVSQFAQEVKSPEVRCFYGFQIMIENVHGHTYANMIEALIKDEKRKSMLFNAIYEIPVIQKKAKWALDWINATKPFVIRLVAFSIVEGVFFSGAFCAIFWLKDKGKMIKTLGHSNELISRDESLHTLCAVMIFKKIKYKPMEHIVHNIMKEAVILEKEFICESIPCDMIGMNKRLMSQYIEFVADRLLQQLGYSCVFKVENPFPFIESINLDGKTNFFEHKVSDYMSGGHSGVSNSSFTTDTDDF
jgi:ribonucleotide reductase beta subunit family protein with ferritin-like domain